MIEKANPEKDLAKGFWQNQPESSKDLPKKRKLEAVPEKDCKEPVRCIQELEKVAQKAKRLGILVLCPCTVEACLCQGQCPSC